MIFPNIEIEKTVQTFDKTRINVKKTFTTDDEVITMLEIDPDGSGIFYDVTKKGYLDWQYNTESVYTIELQVTTDLAATASFTSDIEILDSVTENLFSNDQDLIEYEDTILNYVRDGRNSFIDKHRKAQEIILDELKRDDFLKRDNTPYIASDIVNVDEFREWSTLLTLELIFNSLKKSNEDIFMEKSKHYQSLKTSAKKRACLWLDQDGDGVVNPLEKIDITSIDLRKRG